MPTDPTDWEKARMHKALRYFDELSQAFDPIIGNFNSNYSDDMDRIHRIDPKPILSEAELRTDGRMRLFQCRTCFLKVVFEGAGSILMGWGYWVPGTDEIRFPDVNRLLLNTANEWQLYRFHEDVAQREHVEGANTLPYHVAKSLIERLAEIASTPPELATSLAL
ncbi:MAG TPA: hypothetical protein V6D05_05525 [Stenomitos sp.]